MNETTYDIAGRRIRVLEAGSGDDVVLFLHGAGGAVWTPLLERLSANHRVIAPEHPGFGRSELPDWLMSVGDLAFHYLDLLETLDLRRVHLVGHSIGGWLAAEIAIRSTARIASLSLLSPAGIGTDEEPFGDVFLWSPEETARRQFYDQSLAEARIEALKDADIEVQLQNRAALARLAWSPRLENPQLRHWLHRIDVPTVVVWGENDEVTPFACHRPYLEGLPGAQLFALPETGHALAVERAAEVEGRLATLFKEAVQ